MLSIDNTICNTDDELKLVQASVTLQEDTMASLGNFESELDNFINDTVTIDNEAATLINKRKDDFYEKYSYLKPECEKTGWEKFKDGLKKVGEWCKEHWKDIVKIVIAVVIVVALAIATILTGGAAGGVAGFILAGALKGAIIGGISSSLISAGISAFSHRLKTGSWNDVDDAIFSGVADGLLSGVILGGVTGATSNTIKIVQSAKMWNPGSFKSGYKSMKYHYEKHAIKEGFSKGNNVVKYTKDALDFSNRNANLLKYTYNFKPDNAVWRLVYDNTFLVPGKGGTFDSLGKIVQFWYKKS